VTTQGTSSRVEIFVWLTFVVFIFTNVVTGPMRWLFAISGLTALIYLPAVAIGLAWIFGVLNTIATSRVTHGYLGSIILLLTAVVNGLINIGSFVQVGFGFYVLWPFIFGLVFGTTLMTRLAKSTRFAFALWFISCTGVLLNINMTFPWEGFEYSVANVDVETSREWYAGDAKRLAGFARASFDAAIQITLSSSLALAAAKGISTRFVIAAISLVAIYFTNAKGMLLSFLVMFVLSLISDRWVAQIKVSVFTLLGILGMGLPICSWLAQYHFDMTGIAASPMVFSFTDRIENMWPEALSLMHEHGTVWLGRGFGGIGVSQTYFEPHLFNAADNVFVYASAVGGVGMFLVGSALLIKFMTSRSSDSYTERLSVLLMSAVLVYGLTANVFENGMMALILGMLVRFGTSARSNTNVS
jgi:hypothetical protein